MANATYDVLEIRALIKPEWTELYILCGPPSDGMIGVQGWHKTIVKADVVVLEAIGQALASQDYLTENSWSQAAPS
jgi:hypothetical protein